MTRRIVTLVALIFSLLTATAFAGVLVEGYEITRWDDSNPTAQWKQPTDDNRQYDCGWYDTATLLCQDTADRANYQCSYMGGKVYCQHVGSGVAMASDDRQRLANVLARGIGNRGVVAHPPAANNGYGAYCEE